MESLKFSKVVWILGVCLVAFLVSVPALRRAAAPVELRARLPIQRAP